jgi:hypothetical protein
MSHEIDPIALQDELQQRIHRYLLTSLPICRRFPNLRAQAEKLINKPETVIKGPFLEAIPDFPKGLSLKELVEEGVLHKGFAHLGSPIFVSRLERFAVQKQASGNAFQAHPRSQNSLAQSHVASAGTSGPYSP